LEIDDIFENTLLQEKKNHWRHLDHFRGTDVLLIRKKQYNDAKKGKGG
jgi:hypothetical protein